MSSAKIVNLREAPLLNDIPNQLRKMADDIEKGEIEDVESLYIIIPVLSDYPKCFGFGNLYDNYNPMVTMQLALQFFVNNVVSR